MLALCTACSSPSSDTDDDIGDTETNTSVSSTDGEGPATPSGSASGTSSATTSGGTTDPIATTDDPTTGADASDGTSSSSGSDDSSSSTGVPFEMPADCDYTTDDGLMVIEAEELDFADDWGVSTSSPDATGSGALVWTGPSVLSETDRSVIDVVLHFDEARQYRLEWRTRNDVNQGFAANSTWLKLSGARLYGQRNGNEGDLRFYSRPYCNDVAAMTAIAALPEVQSANCAQGFTNGNWLDPFGVNVLDPEIWSWKTDVLAYPPYDPDRMMVDIPEPGNYLLQLSPRLANHELDRLIFYTSDVPSDEARALGQPETPCVP